MHDQEKTSTRNHTFLGISAFSCSIFFLILILIGIGIASMASASEQTGSHPLKGFAVSIIYYSIFLNIVSLSLGIAGRNEEEANKFLPTLAATISTCAILVTIIILVTGLLTS